MLIGSVRHDSPSCPDTACEHLALIWLPCSSPALNRSLAALQLRGARVHQCLSERSRVTVAGTWPHLTVISVIDILLVAIIIYEFLALIRGTRAALILVGVSVVILAFYFSRVGQLTTLNWL